ncbi:MAG: GNAT family N-acetyltransferase [Clostridia bacterium]
MMIRSLTDQETGMASALKAECWNTDYAGVVPPDVLDPGKEGESMLSWLHERTVDIRRSYGAFDGNALAGYLMASIAETEDSSCGVEVNDLFVNKEYRGRGLGLKLMKAVADEFHQYGFRELVVYNWRGVPSNAFYRHIGGIARKETTMKVKEKELCVDVFYWDTDALRKDLARRLGERDHAAGGTLFEKQLDPDAYMTSREGEEDREQVCRGLYGHNVMATRGTLMKPGIDINLFLKTSDQRTVGAILCDTFNHCANIDVLWIDESFRGRGYGRMLLEEAERQAVELGCLFMQTCTFSYQSPGFYGKCGYETFAVLEDYPEGIKQFFLKKIL